MKHKDKLKLARRLRELEAQMAIAYYKKKGITSEEYLFNVHKTYMKTPVFQTKAWEAHKEKIEKKVDQVIVNQQLAAERRRLKNDSI